MEVRIASNKDTTECATTISGGAGSGCQAVERIGRDSGISDFRDSGGAGKAEP